MAANEAPDLIPYNDTAEDVARHFKVSDRAVRQWLKTTDIPHRRIGGTIRFNLPEVDAWAARGGNTAEPAERSA